MVGFFSVSSNNFSSINTFNISLTSSYFVEGNKPLVLSNNPTKSISFNINDDTIYGIALNISACSPYSQDSNLTVELSGISGTYALETYNLTSFVTAKNSDNQSPLNWQILKFATPIQVTASDVINMSLATTSAGELTLIGQDVCYNLINSKVGYLTGSISSSLGSVGERYIDLTSNSGGLEFVNSSAYGLGDTDFTIDGWYYIPSSTINTVWNPIISFGSGSGFNEYACWSFVYNNNEKTFYFTRYNTNADAIECKLPYSLILNQWNFITLRRKNNELSLWINGINVSTKSLTGNFDSIDQEATKRRISLHVGKFKINNITYNTKMYASNIRIIKNEALYESVSVASPTTVLSILTDGILYRDPDFYGDTYLAAENGAIITKNLTSFNTAAAPISNWPSFDGPILTDGYDKISFLNNEKYVSINSTPSMSADFTIEFWFLSLRSNSPEEYILDGRSSPVSAPYVIGLSGGKIRIYESDTSAIWTGSYTPQTWNHIAICRKGGIVQVTQNGQCVGAFNSGGTTWGGGDLWIGRRKNDAKNFIGYISNLRITNNKALYYNGFDISNTELTPTNKTTLLIKIGSQFNKSVITNKTYRVDTFSLEEQEDDCIVFTPQTINSPYGQDTLDWIRCISNDSIQLSASNKYNLNSTSWSIDFWLHPVATGINQDILKFTQERNFKVYLNTQNQIVFWASSNNTICPVQIPTHKWTHVAIVRKKMGAGPFRVYFYIDGAEVYVSSTDTEDTYALLPLLVGSSFSGYISNLHIRKSNLKFAEILNTANPTEIVRPYLKSRGSRPGGGTSVFSFKAGSPASNSISFSHSVPHLSGSIEFDGDKYYIPYAFNKTLINYSGDYTIEAWINPSSTGKMFLISDTGYAGHTDNEHGYGIGINNGDLEWYGLVRDGNQRPGVGGRGDGNLDYNPHVKTNNGQISANKWNHVVCQVRDNEIEFYINGIKYYDYPSQYRSAITSTKRFGRDDRSPNNYPTVPAFYFNMKHKWNAFEPRSRNLFLISNVDQGPKEMWSDFERIFVRYPLNKTLFSRNTVLLGARGPSYGSGWAQNEPVNRSRFKGLMSYFHAMEGARYSGLDIRSQIYEDANYTIPKPLTKTNSSSVFLTTQTGEDPTFFYNKDNYTFRPSADNLTVLLLQYPYTADSVNRVCLTKKTCDVETINSQLSLSYNQASAEAKISLNNLYLDLYNKPFSVQAKVFINNILITNNTNATGNVRLIPIIERTGSYVFGIVIHEVPKSGRSSLFRAGSGPGFAYASLYFATNQNQLDNYTCNIGYFLNNERKLNPSILNGRSGARTSNIFGDPEPATIVPFDRWVDIAFVGDGRTVVGYVDNIPICYFPFSPSAKTISKNEQITIGGALSASALAEYTGSLGAISTANFNKLSAINSRSIKNVFISDEIPSFNIPTVYWFLQIDDIPGTVYRKGAWFDEQSMKIDYYKTSNDIPPEAIIPNPVSTYWWSWAADRTTLSAYDPAYVSRDGISTLYFNGSNVINPSIPAFDCPMTFEAHFNIAAADFSTRMCIFHTSVIYASDSETAGGSYTIASAPNNNDVLFAVYLENGRIRIILDKREYWSAPGNNLYQADNWNHIAVVYSLSTYNTRFITIFVNGVGVIHQRIFRTNLFNDNYIVSPSNTDVPGESLGNRFGSMRIGARAFFQLLTTGPGRLRERLRNGFKGYLTNIRIVRNKVYSLPDFSIDSNSIKLSINNDSLNIFKDLTKFEYFHPNTSTAVSPLPVGNNVLLNFCGVNQSITIPHKEDFNLYGSIWTFETWINLFTSNNNTRSSLINKGSSYAIYIHETNNVIGIRNKDNIIEWSTASIASSVWYHLAFVCNGANIRLYVNGSLFHTYATKPSEDNLSPINIGYDDTPGFTGYLAGSLANLRLLKGTAEYIQPDNTFSNKKNTVLRLKSPYKAFTYYTSILRDIHIGSILLRDTINPITIDLNNTASIFNLFIHNQSTLNIINNGNLIVTGGLGINVTVGGRLNII